MEEGQADDKIIWMLFISLLNFYDSEELCSCIYVFVYFWAPMIALDQNGSYVAGRKTLLFRFESVIALDLQLVLTFS